MYLSVCFDNAVRYNNTVDLNTFASILLATAENFLTSRLHNDR